MDMKKILLGLTMALVALCLPVQASAYSEEMAQLAEMLNKELAQDSSVQSVKYDGTNMIFTLNVKGQLSADEINVMSLVLGTPEGKAMIVPQIKQTLGGGDDAKLFFQVLQSTNTGLEFRMDTGEKVLTFNLKPEDLL